MIRSLRLALPPSHHSPRITQRVFSLAPVLSEKALPPRRKILESEITESFLKGSGPGGQKINKTSSAVQLKHLPTGIVVKCQETRSREQNRKWARQELGERLDLLEKGDGSRVAIKAERATKKKASAEKKRRRKYRKLDEGKGAAEAEEGEVVDEHREDVGVVEEGVDQEITAREGLSQDNVGAGQTKQNG